MIYVDINQVINVIDINSYWHVTIYSVSMIKLIDNGHYSLIQTHKQTKIITLGSKTFAWVVAGKIGEILVFSHKAHEIDHILALGNYRTYEVEDEPDLVDLLHLELFVGEGKWQGYILPTGLPTDAKKRSEIIPTKEIITIKTH